MQMTKLTNFINNRSFRSKILNESLSLLYLNRLQLICFKLLYNPRQILTNCYIIAYK